jgi:ABC-type dipeptide/oligopeptide/nickel transport system permease component
VDHASRILAILGSSMPSFWFGIILLSIFFAGLGWFPPSRIGQETLNFITAPNTSWRWYTHLVTVDSLLNGQWWIFLDGIRHLILPVAILALLNSAIIVRVTRSSMLEALSKDYITAAKAKGLTRRLVINRYARRNALIPAITLAGLMIASLFTGITITETVFDMGGIGAYTAELARSLDMSSANWYALPCAIDFILYNPSRRHPL